MSPHAAVIVVQARMESTRLPGKVMKLLSGKPLIIHLLNRLLADIPSHPLIVAISDHPTSQVLFETLKAFKASLPPQKKERLKITRGHPSNVYARFLAAIQEVNAKILVRVTADNPLTDCGAIVRGMEHFTKENLDYLWMENIPKGLGCDLFNIKTFKKFENKPLTEAEKEHLVPIFRNRPHLRGKGLPCSYPSGATALNFSVDSEEDFQKMNRLFLEHYEEDQDFDLNKIVQNFC